MASIADPHVIRDGVLTFRRGVREQIFGVCLLCCKGGSRIFIGEDVQVLRSLFCWRKGRRTLLKWRSRVRKRHLFVPEGRLFWRKRRRIYLQGAFVSEKAYFRARRAPLLAGRASLLLKRASLWAKRAHFRIRRAPSLAGSRPYNASGTKIDPGLRCSADGNEKWRSCAFGVGAPVSIGEGLVAPAAAPLDPPLLC